MSMKSLHKLGWNLFSRGSTSAEMPPSTTDDATISAARKVLAGHGKQPLLKRLLPFLGPAFIASVAYVDPGNFATNIQGGAEFGYLLVWVIIASNLMAMLIQALSAKLGIATGHNLAEMCRERFPRPVVWGMWVVSEIVAMATDMAEFLGAALGFTLLFHFPLLVSGLLTAVCTVLLLSLQQRGFRPLEAVITVLVGVIALCYLLESVLSHPDWGQIGMSVVMPRLSGTESLLLAVGILGATVMPHVIFLHSALTQSRIVTKDPAQQRRIFRFEIADVVIAMGIAGLVNLSMLIMAASTFYTHGLTHIASIEEAYRTLTPLLGNAAGEIFGISLLASGLSSSAVGTMAGQVIMQGFLRVSINVWVRRVVTMLPALIVIAIGFDPTRTLVISQVVLSFGIPFALIPLVIFTSQRKIMGALVNHRVTTGLAILVAALIVGLNLYLIFDALQGLFV